MSPTTRLALLAGAVALAASAQAQMKLKADTATRPAAPAVAANAPQPDAASAQPAPSANAEKETAGKMAAFGWLTLLDRKDWGTAWDSSSTIFRQTVPLGSWMDAIPKVREPFGVLVSREPSDVVYKTTLPGRPDGQYVTAQFASQFDKGIVDEMVTTMLDTDGRWRVTGYTYTRR